MILKLSFLHRTRKFPFCYLLIIICFLSCTFFFSTVTAQDQLFKKTPRDAEGPFYPIIRQSDEDNDLTQVSGQKQKAEGDTLSLSGLVTDERGQPYSNAVVEIWQTGPNGRYKDNRDRSPGKRDPYFQYWGKAKCGDDGRYSFSTIVPGKYHPRPSHIHFKVWINDSVRLTSQIYFREPSGQGDDKSSPFTTPDLQTVDLQKVGKGQYQAWFHIVL